MNHKLVKNILAASVATLLIGTASQAVAQERRRPTSPTAAVMS